MKIPSTFLQSTKWSFTTRRVTKEDVAGLSQNLFSAKSGDLVLAEVVEINQHKGIQLANGRRSIIYPGDQLVLACGARYAPDQFEGRAELFFEEADLLAAGGIIGKAHQAHERMLPPTRLKPLGLLTNRHNQVINLRNYTIPESLLVPDIPIIAVVGASMNSGKTTATASLAHGITRAGFKVAGIKMTGTGAFGDFNYMQDAGLHYVADFTDAGMASTYLQPVELIEKGFKNLLNDAQRAGAEIIVVEIADGIFQKETAALLKHSSLIRRHVNGVLFAGGDAVSIVGGVDTLRTWGYEPLAASGRVTQSPLSRLEAEQAANIELYSREELIEPSIAKAILRRIHVESVSPIEAIA